MQWLRLQNSNENWDYLVLKMMKLGGIGTSWAVPYFVGPGSPVSLISQGPERSETLEACCAQGIWLRILGGRHDWQILAVCISV